jgi:hypothetical protein
MFLRNLCACIGRITHYHPWIRNLKVSNVALFCDGTPKTWRWRAVAEVKLHAPLTATLDWGECSASHSVCFLPESFRLTWDCTQSIFPNRAGPIDGITGDSSPVSVGLATPSPLRAEDHERVELYLYSHAWAVRACCRVTFTFYLHTNGHI